MLQLHVTNIDYCRVSQILANHRLNAKITDSTIIIDNQEIPEKVVKAIFSNATITGVQNYLEEESEESNEEEVLEVKPTNPEIHTSKMLCRGEAYKLNSFDDYEGKVKECVIIIQNDYYNSLSDDTVALFCTTHYEERAPMYFSFKFTSKTMFNHSCNRLEFYDSCTFFVGRIKAINRNELGDYLGTMNNIFMDKLQPIIDFCLGLKRSRSVNMAQLQILSTVNIEDLLKISNSNDIVSDKVDQFLKFFEFDMSYNGMKYVKEAIIIAYNESDYNLEYLAQRISEEENIEASEILRLIVTRIKERFNLKITAVSISFIRLIERLVKG